MERASVVDGVVAAAVVVAVAVVAVGCERE